MNIGILALQGAFIEHEKMFDKLGISTFEIRQKSDIECEYDAIVIPGGESTVISKLLNELELYTPLKTRIDQGMPVFGTCAGLILLAKEISNDDTVCFATMDMKVRRNAYGRQLGSFYTEAEFKGIGKIPMTFIRAPYIESVYGDAEALAEVDGHIVAARQGNMLATAFHPELNDDLSVHKYFADIVRKYSGRA